MTEITKRIFNIAERLDPDRQRTLLEIAESMATPARFLDSMTAREREELERAIGEADREESVTQEELDARLDAIAAPARK